MSLVNEMLLGSALGGLTGAGIGAATGEDGSRARRAAIGGVLGAGVGASTIGTRGALRNLIDKSYAADREALHAERIRRAIRQSMRTEMPGTFSGGSVRAYGPGGPGDFVIKTSAMRNELLKIAMAKQAAFDEIVKTAAAEGWSGEELEYRLKGAGFFGNVLFGRVAPPQQPMRMAA